MSEKLPTWKEKCGCVVDCYRYHKICATHKKEFDEVHDRWTADKKRSDAERDAREAAEVGPAGVTGAVGPGPCPKGSPAPEVKEGDLTSLM